MLIKSFAISPLGRQALCSFNSGRFASSRSRLCFRQGDALDAIFETENCIFNRTPNTTCLLGVKEPSFDAHRWLRMSISPTTPLDHHSIFFLKLSVYPGVKVEKHNKAQRKQTRLDRPRKTTSGRHESYPKSSTLGRG